MPVVEAIEYAGSGKKRLDLGGLRVDVGAPTKHCVQTEKGADA